jgi:hypothetical protein
MNAVAVSTLRPGLLVSLRTNLTGNVSYRAQEIEADHIDPVTGARVAKWETERKIADPAEHERAVKARGKARSLIVGVCAQSAFGLLCPETDADKLSDAIAAAREVAEEFNLTASLTRITVNVICGRIASDDVEAVRAINSEVRELLETMERGVRNLEPERIREAANRARALSSMLSPAAASRANAAIDAARSAARAIVKAGETAAVEVDAKAVELIRTSRMAFLDLDDGDTVEVQAPVSTAAAIDFEIDLPAPEPIAPAVSVFDLDVA